jgi:hypothetical protein
MYADSSIPGHLLFQCNIFAILNFPLMDLVSCNFAFVEIHVKCSIPRKERLLVKMDRSMRSYGSCGEKEGSIQATIISKWFTWCSSRAFKVDPPTSLTAAPRERARRSCPTTRSARSQGGQQPAPPPSPLCSSGTAVGEVARTGTTHRILVVSCPRHRWRGRAGVAARSSTGSMATYGTPWFRAGGPPTRRRGASATGTSGL